MEDVRSKINKIKRNRALVVQRSILLIFGCCVILATSSIYAGQRQHVQGSRSLEQTVVDSVLNNQAAPANKASEPDARNEEKREDEDETAEKNVGTTPRLNDCGNSEGWLNSSRYGNLNDDPLFFRDPDPGDGDWSTLDDNDYGDLRLFNGSPAVCALR